MFLVKFFVLAKFISNEAYFSISHHLLPISALRLLHIHDIFSFFVMFSIFSDCFPRSPQFSVKHTLKIRGRSHHIHPSRTISFDKMKLAFHSSFTK